MNMDSIKRWPWIMLFSRTFMFFGVQAVLALGFYLAGKGGAWNNAANWWPFIVTIVNFIYLFLLVRNYKAEGRSYWSIFRLDKSKIASDLLAVLGIIIIIGPVSYLPNVMLGGLLFGDPQSALNLILRPLPYSAVLISIIVFPVTQGLVEIPFYFTYVMPRLQKQGLSLWLSLGLPSLFLALQHTAIPFLFNINFIIWRALMFIPFALFTGIVMWWRPRLIPYIAIVHILMDGAFAMMFLSMAY